MAERVHRHMESMEEEFLETKRLNLLQPHEIKITIKKRQEFEYKVNGVSKNLQDFLNYIEYEKALLKLIQKRRNRLKIAEKKASIEFKIINRIMHIYQIAILRFPSKSSLFLAFFDFCRKSNFTKVASNATENMLQKFSQNVEVWKLTVAWFAYNQKDYQKAINIVNKGLAIHKNSEALYKQAVGIQLLKVSPPSSNKEKSEKALAKEELTCKHIEVYVKAIIANIKDYKFYLEILKMLEEHPFTKNVQNLIIDHLQTYYSNEEEVKNVLANRTIYQ